VTRFRSIGLGYRFASLLVASWRKSWNVRSSRPATRYHPADPDLKGVLATDVEHQDLRVGLLVTSVLLKEGDSIRHQRPGLPAAFGLAFGRLLILTGFRPQPMSTSNLDQLGVEVDIAPR
jgi:hypothetical protein